MDSNRTKYVRLFYCILSMFINGILKWPMYLVEIVLAIFTIVKAFDEKRGDNRIGRITKGVGFLRILCCVFTLFCLITGIYNTEKIEKLEENYTYFGQMKNGIAEGKGRVFNENGTWIRSGHFIDNKLDGDGKE